MPTYLWEATTRGGEYRSGQLDADNEDTVRERLGQQGLSVTKVKRKPLELTLPTIGSGVGLKDLVVFTRTFSTMIDAGLPIVQCLDMLSGQADNKHFGKIAEDLAGVKATLVPGKHFLQEDCADAVADAIADAVATAARS